MPPVGWLPLVSPLASFLAPPLGPSCLLASYALRASSAHPFASPSAACFLLVGSSAHPWLVSPWLPRLIDKRDGAARSAGDHRLAGGGCLLVSDGDGLRAVIDGGWRRAAGGVVAACLPRGDGRSGSIVSLIVSFPSHRLIQSARSRLLSSSHRLISSTGRALLFLSARPPPACSSRLACLDLFPRPRPGDAWAAAWLAAAGVRTVCLRSHPLCRSLAAARSLVAIQSVSIVPLVPAWGVVGRFMGYSTRYLVGVGVFKYMPLNRILWLLVGIFCDVVRCHFSALPVASFSLVCPVLRPLSAVASWCRGGHVCAVSWRKRRGVPFRDRGRSPLPASWDGRCWGRFAVPCGWRRRVVVLAFIGSRVPCPLGRGNM